MNDSVQRWNSENVARGVGHLGNINFVPLFFEGHSLYCVNGVVGEQSSDDFWDRELSGVKLPTSFIKRCDVYRVIAKGPQVGKPCSRKHQHLFKRCRCMSDEYAIGDLIVVPKQPPVGLKRSPLCEYEWFVEESIPYYIYRKE